MLMPEPTDVICEHLGAIVDAGHPTQEFCEECLADGADGAALRICLSCGHVGCGEGSHSDHAAQHYAETDHPIAATVGGQVVLRWCYPDARPV
jgi:CPA1 family monovalent cation:H+ antiporter